MMLHDRIPINGRIKDARGFLVADAVFARTGIQEYTAAELGLPLSDGGKVLRIYRAPAEVFSDQSIATYAHLPVTDDHPGKDVTADNFKELAVGMTGPSVMRKDEGLAGKVVVSDAGAISKVEGGKQELSVGYSATLQMTPGQTPEGETYDGQMKDIRANHLAIVAMGRCGEQCRISDGCECGDCKSKASKGPKPMADTPALKAVLVDGISINTTDQGAQAIEKLQKQLTDAAAAKSLVDTKLAEEVTKVATKDAEIATLKKQLDDAKVTPAQMRDAARAYAKTVKQAKALSPDTTIGDDMDELSIRKAVVTAKLGDKAKSWNDAQIATSFDTLAAALKDEDLEAEATRDIVRDGLKSKDLSDAEKSANDAYAQMVKDMQSGQSKAAA